ncbi:MAG: 4Fe-4S binding protein [Gemmatimonadetes bacterium]|nr:4Fe-4S binding protein [Gemmatimonadota bacterium]NNM03983.1 4Fe-4S binding protein [Gemmatimonadota bacterium]
MAMENVYRRLQEHIDNMPIAYPATESGVEIRLLEHLFTPEEAEMALHLSAVPEPVEKIHRRAKKDGINYGDLKKGLRRLAKKGAIIGVRIKGEPAYSKAMLAIGMFEFQAGRITKEYHEDFRQYMDEGFAEAIFTKKTGQMRTIPINEEVLPERRIGTHDGAKELVMNSQGPFAVIPCVCRDGMDLEESSCQQTEIRETCLLMGDFADKIVGTGVGKALTKEEMVGMLDRAHEVGMVIQPQNTQDPHFICCCCGCCCAVLTTAKKLPRPAEYFDANYFAEVDEDLCTECRICSDRCQMDAIAFNGGPSQVDLMQCIGCGLCISTCPEGAIQLYEKADVKTPPRTQDALYLQIMRERIGSLGIAKLAAKKVLGMKI